MKQINIAHKYAIVDKFRLKLVNGHNKFIYDKKRYMNIFRSQKRHKSLIWQAIYS